MEVKTEFIVHGILHLAFDLNFPAKTFININFPDNFHDVDTLILGIVLWSLT